MKKSSILLAFGLLLYTPTASLIANYDFQSDNMQFEFNDDDDDFAIDTDLNNLSLDITPTNLSMTRSPFTNAEQIYSFFTFIDGNTAAQNAILNLPIYLHTSPIRNRPILEYPFTLPYGFDMRDNNSISVQFFLNAWSHKNFTKTTQNLGSYFLLGNPERATILQELDDNFGQDTLTGLTKSLVLFDPAIVQENRIGAVFASHVAHNNFFVSAQLPVLYTERNLYLTPSQKAAISISSLGGMLTTDGVDQNEFIYEHIVMDQFGLGDLKVKAMYEMHASNNFDLDLGGFIIFPTAVALKQGMIGTWFDQNNDRAYLDLATIDLFNITAENQDDIANFFLAAIDKLSSNILNCPLGNNGHVVLAPSINFDWYFAQNWQFSNDFSLQVPLGANEQRFYQKIQSQAEFLNAYNAAYQIGADDPISFVNYVNTQLQDLFFPYVFPTMVFPGIVFNSTNQFAYKFNACDFFLGSNFWYQGAEHLKPFINTQNSQNFGYDYTGAAAASAAQEKLFGRVDFNINSTDLCWCFSLYGDITIWNSGIGNDYTVGLFIDCKF